METPLTYSVAEAARVLGVSRNMAYELIRTNQLPHIKMGRRLLISRAALRKFTGSSEEDDAPLPVAGEGKIRAKEELPEEVTYIVTIRRVAGSSTPLPGPYRF